MQYILVVFLFYARPLVCFLYLWLVSVLHLHLFVWFLDSTYIAWVISGKKKKADGKWGAAIPHCTDQSCSLGASDRRGQGLLLCPSPFCASLLKDRACLKYEDLPRLKRRFCEAVVWGTVIWKHVLHPGKSRGREFDEFGLERVKLIYLFFLVVLGELISFLKINVWILL